MEFWETAFRRNQQMWGADPSKSATIAKDFFLAIFAKSILVPGIGYGRNARLFQQAGMSVTGIEISETAIELAKKYLDSSCTLYHGSVTDMPFDSVKYDGIFCYGLIYLLEAGERAKLIKDCYDQLADGGVMIFTLLSKDADTYGKGNYLGKDRYEPFPGIGMFFYDRESVVDEFREAGLFDVSLVEETYPFYLVKCKKGFSGVAGFS